MHSAAVLRLTGTERAVAEIAAIAEHMASLTTAAAAFQLRPEGESSLVKLLDEESAPDAAEVLADIRAWCRQALGGERLPAIWRAMAHHPKMLEATWRKDRLVLGVGVLDKLVKACAALAVAQFRQSDYWIAYLSQFLRTSCGFDDRALVELTGSVMHYVSFNTIAHGMGLDAPYENLRKGDFDPGGRLEHAPLPGRSRITRS